MISQNEKKIIEELEKIRFLDSDKEDDDEAEEEIEGKVIRYEKYVHELCTQSNIEIIPYLCEIAEDNATEQSSVEYLIKMIVYMIDNDIENSIKYIIKGTTKMIPKAYYKACFLHTLIVRKKNLQKVYIRALRNSSEEEKCIIKMLLLYLKRKNIEGDSVSYILENI